jgi:hypothetical protein
MITYESRRESRQTANDHLRIIRVEEADSRWTGGHNCAGLNIASGQSMPATLSRRADLDRVMDTWPVNLLIYNPPGGDLQKMLEISVASSCSMFSFRSTKNPVAGGNIWPKAIFLTESNIIVPAASEC